MVIQPGTFLNYKTLRLMLDEYQQLRLWRTSSGTFSGAGVGLATSGAHPTEPQGGAFTPALTRRVSLSISVHVASSPERPGVSRTGPRPYRFALKYAVLQTCLPEDFLNNLKTFLQLIGCQYSG